VLKTEPDDVKGYAAQIERERIKERTLRGKRSRARMGFMVQATGKGLFGYRYVRETKSRVIYEPEAEIVRRIFDACRHGDTCYTIAVGLNDDGICTFAGNKWHPLTVKRMVTNPAYKGTTLFGRTKRIPLGGKRFRLEQRNPEDWIEIPGVTPAIVSEGMFEAAQTMLSQPRRNPGRTSRRYLLTGHIECECGAPVVGSCLNHSYRYYRCRSTWPTSTRPKTCDGTYIRADRLEEAVWNKIRQILQDPEMIIAEIKRQQGGSSVIEEETARLEASVRRLEEQEHRLIRLFGIGEVTEEYVTREVRQVKKAREILERDLFQLREQRREIISLDGLSEQVLAFCSRIAKRIDELGFDEKRAALSALQIRIVVGRDGNARLKGAIPKNLATTERTSA